MKNQVPDFGNRGSEIEDNMLHLWIDFMARSEKAARLDLG